MVRGNDKQSSSLLPMKRLPQGSLKIIVENKPSPPRLPLKINFKGACTTNSFYVWYMYLLITLFYWMVHVLC